MSNQDQLNYFKEQVIQLESVVKELTAYKSDAEYLEKLREEAEGRYKEKILILESQLRCRGKKPEVPKKPELDWNQKIRFIQQYAPNYKWEGIFEGLEVIFQRHCLTQWEGAQKAYEKSTKRKKPGAIPANVIPFPTAGGAQ